MGLWVHEMQQLYRNRLKPRLAPGPLLGALGGGVKGEVAGVAGLDAGAEVVVEEVGGPGGEVVRSKLAGGVVGEARTRRGLLSARLNRASNRWVRGLLGTSVAERCKCFAASEKFCRFRRSKPSR